MTYKFSRVPKPKTIRSVNHTFSKNNKINSDFKLKKYSDSRRNTSKISSIPLTCFPQKKGEGNDPSITGDDDLIS